MQDLLKYMEKTLGGYGRAAEYLGYTTRQYYNIRKKVESGVPLLTKVEAALLHKILLLIKQRLEKIETVEKEP